MSLSFQLCSFLKYMILFTLYWLLFLNKYPNWNTGFFSLVVISYLYDHKLKIVLWKIHINWRQISGLNKCSLTSLILASTSLRRPGDLCHVFHTNGQSLPGGAHVCFPWGFVPLMEIMRMHPRERSLPKGFILPQCANIILIKINRNCTHASREEIDS